MRTKNRYLYLTDTEWRVMLLALNSLRSKLIAQGRYTDAVDEIIMKMAELGVCYERIQKRRKNRFAI